MVALEGQVDLVDSVGNRAVENLNDANTVVGAVGENGVGVGDAVEGNVSDDLQVIMSFAAGAFLVGVNHACKPVHSAHPFLYWRLCLMVGWVWRQSFERAPRVQARSPFRLGRCCRRSAGTFDGKPRGGGKRSHPIAFGGGLFRPLTLRPFGRALSGWFRKNFFRSSFRVSSSRFKAVRMGFVRVVSKKASAFPSRVVLSHFKWRGVGFGGTCSKIICGRDE